MLLITTITAIVAAFLAVAAFAGWIKTQKQLNQQRAQHESLMKNLSEEIRRVNRGAMGMGKHLIDIEQQLQHFESSPTGRSAERERTPVLNDISLNAASSVDVTPNYNQVLQLLDQGCRPEQITKAYGISKAEIELMALVRDSSAISS